MDWKCGSRTDDAIWKQFDCDWEGAHLRPGNFSLRDAKDVNEIAQGPIIFKKLSALPVIGRWNTSKSPSADCFSKEIREKRDSAQVEQNAVSLLALAAAFLAIFIPLEQTLQLIIQAAAHRITGFHDLVL